MCSRSWNLLILLFLLGVGSSYAQILNPSFEETEPNSADNLAPLYWEIEEYAFSNTEFTPDPDSHGTYSNWQYQDFPLTSTHGDYFLLLSTSDILYDSSTDRGVARQPASFAAGQTLKFDYFFGTCDYLGWNDYASVKLLPVDPNSGAETIHLLWAHIMSIPPEEHREWNPDDNYLMYNYVVEVGDYGSTAGWQTYAYTFDETTAGEYELEFGVYDVGDQAYKSYLCVDNIGMVYIPPAGDVSPDGYVNAEDLAILSNHMGDDCTDPNSTCEYINLFGQIETMDYNGDGVISQDDTLPIIENWLWRPE